MFESFALVKRSVGFAAAVVLGGTGLTWWLVEGSGPSSHVPAGPEVVEKALHQLISTIRVELG